MPNRDRCSSTGSTLEREVRTGCPLASIVKESRGFNPQSRHTEDVKKLYFNELFYIFYIDTEKLHAMFILLRKTRRP